MSESIAIPKHKGKQRLVATPTETLLTGNAASPYDSAISNSYALSTSGMSTASSPFGKTPESHDKDKAKAPTVNRPFFGHERRASLLSSSISKSEHTVINIGDADRPRLITCVKASQGFDWNTSIFLPSYLSDYDSQSDLERRQDPVEDIFITEEEAETMFPR